ncbi:hypothetical protein EGI20_13470 [Aquitalea sp. S1-19]|nr:hypothetical protein [Aquitalea sp. S1-19]
MDALELACLDEGPRDVPVVLLLHGFPDSSAVWRYQLLALLADVMALLDQLAPRSHIALGRHDWGVAQG